MPPPPPPPTPKIRLAISGGGLAGASLLHALSPYPQIDAHVFESSPSFGEAGAAIGLSEPGLRALELMGPSVVETLSRAGAVKSRGVRWYLGAGPHAGEMIADDELNASNRRAQIVHRADFVRELLKGVEGQGRMHAGKKLIMIVPKEEEGGAMTLYFGDGTTHECDVLVGADGVRSFVRTQVLGDGDLAAVPRRADWWAVQTLKPYEEARKALGEGFVDVEDPVTYAWVGDGAFVMHNLLSEGNLTQFVVSVPCVPDEKPDPYKSTREVTAEELEGIFRSWPDPMATAVRELVCNEPTQTAFYRRDHKNAFTYVKGHVCIIGDAAHTTTPWQGSGAVISLEDSLILSTLLGEIQSPAHISVALQIYDQVRRPRTQRIVASSYDTGVIITGQDPEYGLDLHKLQGDLISRWDYILTLDVARHRDMALAWLRDCLRTQRFDPSMM